MNKQIFIIPNQNNTCRLCLSTNADINVLENLKMLENVVKHCKVQVEKNDGLPEFICLRCMLRVEDFSKFIEQCCLNDRTLRLRCKDEALIKTDKGVSNSIFEDNENGNFDNSDETFDNNYDESFSQSLDKTESVNLDNDTLMRSVQVADNGEEYVSYLGVRIIITRPKLFEKTKVRKEARNQEKSDGLALVSGKYLCPVCGLYKSKDHELSHSEIKKFLCEICKAGFKLKHLLQHHITRHHTALKQFECDDCGKRYKFKDDIYKHIKFTHSNTPKLHVCAVCDKSYYKQHSLRNHMKYHSGEKNFECDHCGKTFVEKEGIKSHMRTHSKEKPFSCKICKKSFSRIGSLHQHIRLHTGERPYECPICKKGYAQLGNMKSHFRHNHKGCKFEYYSLKKKILSHITIPKKKHSGGLI